MYLCIDYMGMIYSSWYCFLGFIVSGSNFVRCNFFVSHLLGYSRAFESCFENYLSCHHTNKCLLDTLSFVTVLAVQHLLPSMYSKPATQFGDFCRSVFTVYSTNTGCYINQNYDCNNNSMHSANMAFFFSLFCHKQSDHFRIPYPCLGEVHSLPLMGK